MKWLNIVFLSNFQINHCVINMYTLISIATLRNFAVLKDFYHNKLNCSIQMPRNILIQL